ncbi:sulfatase family protein [Portibacter lacus]|uniref:N-acetylgalactosamine-6-sulfatase n=1 Tax=Portibacter lacus TaxID=1099794 RepID=A0AA37WDX7_9BACT|nr:sulfatase-like hydrolase/transferase [Portibacter lacus]GLR17398.1 N-acetylgalactosamine-6-sulfatase [Portibacter lacus]
MKDLKINAVVLFMLVAMLTSCDAQVNQPNIILIMTDDQGWFDAGFNGNEEILTPWSDSLAKSGVILSRFYSASAVCSPTRASVITGRNPLRMHIPYANDGHMLKDEVTIPEILKGVGYSTGHFGKWHLGTLTKKELDANRGGKAKFEHEFSIPSEHGYDTYFCSESKVPTYDPMIFPAKFGEGESKHYGWRAVENGDSTKAYGTAYWTGEDKKVKHNLEGDDSRIIMDRVLPFIEKSKEEQKPFFSTIWFHTPHLPVVSNKEHRDLYSKLDLQRQIYYGTITAMDEQLGRLWTQLGEMGIQEETIIFFCSDNGPERKTPGSAGDFRERKRSLYEGGVRVPAFAVWKGSIEGGRKVDFPMVTSDYLPTILDLLNMKHPDNRPIDGVSVLDALHGKTTERTKPIGFICRPSTSWVNNEYKLIKEKQNSEYELYNLLDDPYEKKNIIGEFPEVAKALEKELDAWIKSVEDSKEGADYESSTRF